MSKQKLKKWLYDESSGEVMLESTIIITMTLFIMIAMISLGFLFYQQAMLTTVATEAATEIASNYKLSSQNDDGDIKLYRTTFALNKMEAACQQQAKEFVENRIPLTTLGMDTQVTVDNCEVVMDNIGRLHTEVTISMKCDFLFSGALKYFDIIDDTPTFSATGRAECLDITAYAGHIQFFQYIDTKLNEDGGNGATFLKNVAEIVENVKSIMDVFK